MREAVTIHLGPALRRASYDLPGSPSDAGHIILPYLVFLRVGFTEPGESPPPLVRSYRTISPLPAGNPAGGILSVALALFLRTVGVTHHPALWSADFPHPFLDKSR